MFLGRVRGIVREGDGGISVVIDFGGFLGLGSRPIAVPVDAMVLLGRDMEVVALTLEQLRQFSTFSPSGTNSVRSSDNKSATRANGASAANFAVTYASSSAMPPVTIIAAKLFGSCDPERQRQALNRRTLTGTSPNSERNVAG
jgi:hypothetical protein